MMKIKFLETVAHQLVKFKIIINVIMNPQHVLPLLPLLHPTVEMVNLMQMKLVMMETKIVAMDVQINVQ